MISAFSNWIVSIIKHRAPFESSRRCPETPCNYTCAVGEEGLEPPESLDTAFTVLPATNYGLLSQNVHPKPLSNEEKKMVDRLLCYSEHFSIIYVRFSFLHRLNYFTFKLTTVLPVVQGSNLHLFGAGLHGLEP